MTTELSSVECDVATSCRQFNDSPTQKAFSTALAHSLIQDAQQFLARLQKNEAAKTLWGPLHPNVALFETVAFLWCHVSFKVNDAVQCAFEEDKNAVKSGVLNGLTHATSIIRVHWPDFWPHLYLFSRVFFYPKEAAQAACNFRRLLQASARREAPLFPDELPSQSNPVLHPADEADDLDALVQRLYTDIEPAQSAAVSALVNHYLDYRID